MSTPVIINALQPTSSSRTGTTTKLIIVGGLAVGGGLLLWYLMNRKKAEVYHVRGTPPYSPLEAYKPVMTALNARLATKSEVTEAYKAGAFWCSYGFTKEGVAVNCYYVNDGGTGCGGPLGLAGGPEDAQSKAGQCGINLYGIKPAEGSDQIPDGFTVMPWNREKWSRYDA